MYVCLCVCVRVRCACVYVCVYVYVCVCVWMCMHGGVCVCILVLYLREAKVRTNHTRAKIHLPAKKSRKNHSPVNTQIAAKRTTLLIGTMRCSEASGAAKTWTTLTHIHTHPHDTHVYIMKIYTYMETLAAPIIYWHPHIQTLHAHIHINTPIRMSYTHTYVTHPYVFHRHKTLIKAISGTTVVAVSPGYVLFMHMYNTSAYAYREHNTVFSQEAESIHIYI